MSPRTRKYGVPAIAAALCVTSAPLAAEIGGSVALESRWLSDAGPGEGATDYQSASAELHWRGRLMDDIDGKVRVYGRASNEDPAHDALRLDDAWVERARGPWDIRAGQQRISWGVMESSRVTDALNASDFQADLIEPRAIANPTARLRYWQAPYTFEGYWQPVTAANIYPGPDSPSFFGGGRSDLDYRSDERLGARFLFEGRDYYLSVSWLRGPEVDTYTFPHLIFADDEPVRSERVGLAGQWFAGDLVVRGEAVHRRLIDPVDSAVQRVVGPVADEETLYSVGVEYTMLRWFGRSDATVFAEYFRSSERQRAGALTNDLFLGAEVRFNDLRSQTLEVGLQDTFSDEENRMLRVRYGRLLTSHVELRVEYTRAQGIYAGAPGSDARDELHLGLTLGL